jgi:predicted GNAT family acetyltransferase
VTDAPEPTDVVDVPDESRFVFRAPGGTAELDYHLNGSRLVLIHTEVPEALSGHGVGGTLVRAAMDRAARDGLTVVPWCPFARRWLQGHPDEAARVTLDWDSPRPQQAS